MADDEKLGWSGWNKVCTRARYSRSSSKIDSVATTGDSDSVRRRGGEEGQARRRGNGSKVRFCGVPLGEPATALGPGWFAIKSFAGDESSLGNQDFICARNESQVSK